jgi:hypothetical protein
MKRTCICIAALLLVLAAPLKASQPVVFWVSDPLEPGQTALLFGDGIGADVVATGEKVPDGPVAGPPENVPAGKVNGEQLAVLQASDLCAKVVLPDKWGAGLYAIRLKNKSGESQPIFLNRTEAWWWLGGSTNAALGVTSDVAVPGEELRVFGKNFGVKTRAWLGNVALETVKAEKYTATFRVPVNLAPGDYALWVHNGFGGALGFGEPLNVKVTATLPWAMQQFNVREFGAVGDYVADDTAAFTNALARAAQGGGIVYVPRGNYKITAKLVIPARTVLRGESREASFLVVPKNQPEFDAVIGGDGDFAVEKLTIIAKAVKRMIMCPDNMGIPFWRTKTKGRNVHLTSLRLQQFYFDRHIAANDLRRLETGGPTSIELNGPDMWLRDLVIVSAGHPVMVHNAWHNRIEGCNLGTGRGGSIQWDRLEESVFENNDLHPIDLEGTYGGIQGNANRIYFAGNYWHNGFGIDREALAFDGPYYSYWIGKPGRCDGNTFTAPEPVIHYQFRRPVTDGELDGQACLVVNGKGLGQYIPIVTNKGNTITLERPWTVPLDETSVISIQAHKSKAVFFNNRTADDSGAFQLYSQGHAVIFDGNQCERTGGLFGNSWDTWSQDRGVRRYSSCYFNQWLNNRVAQGFLYDQSGHINAIIGIYAGPNDQDKPLPPSHAVQALGNIIRGNQVQQHTTLAARFSQPLKSSKKLLPPYIGRDTLFEDNQIADTAVGIQLDRYFLDTLIRNNHFRNCNTNILNQAINTVIVEQN